MSDLDAWPQVPLDLTVEDSRLRPIDQATDQFRLGYVASRAFGFRHLVGTMKGCRALSVRSCHDGSERINRV